MPSALRTALPCPGRLTAVTKEKAQVAVAPAEPQLVVRECGILGGEFFPDGNCLAVLALRFRPLVAVREERAKVGMDLRDYVAVAMVRAVFVCQLVLYAQS